MTGGHILFLYENEAPFVRTDLSILRERFEVTAVDCADGPTLHGVFRALRRVDASFSWFAMGYAARAVLLGRLLRRPSVVVSGGWDVISIPEISYGSVRTRGGRARARFVTRNADLVLALSDWSRDTIRLLCGRNPDRLYLGVDAQTFRPKTKEDIVVTIGNVNRGNLARKGLETFVRAAADFPHVPFVLVGQHLDDAADTLRRVATPNVSLPGWLPEEELRDLVGRARVYVQVSRNEGFGLALAEAMAAGCVPVVTREGAIPEVAGDVGFYVPFGDAAATSAAIREALTSSRAPAAREHVATRFSIAARRRGLYERLDCLLGV